MNNITESINSLNETINKLTSHITTKTKFPLDSMTMHTKKDFSDFLKKGDSNFFSKSLSSDNGSLLMPSDTCIHIQDKMNIYSPIRCVASSIKISTEALDVLLDIKAPEASWSSEEKYPENNNNAEFKKIKISVHEIFARVKATQKLLDDSSMDIYEWFTNKVSRQIAIVENKAFLFGDGEGKPKGILTYESTDKANEFGKFQQFSTGANGGFNEETGADILINALHSLPRQFAKNAVWLMSRSALAHVQKLKDSSGRYIWQPSISTTTSTLLGYPIVVDDDMPELSNEKPTTSIIFGDFASAYQIVDRTDLQIFRDPYSSKPFVEFCATKRTGGDVINFDALKMVNFGN